MIETGPTLSPISFISSSILVQAVSISSSPVRKSKMSPSPSFSWIVTAVLIDASTQSVSGSLLKYTSTGYILPGMFNLGEPQKYCWNLTASIVADITINLRSDRLLRIYLMSPKRTSVLSVRSWASSRMMTEYRYRLRSIMASRSSIPSVIYFRMVLREVRSQNLMEQPTSSPSSTSNSSLTLLATDIAATLLGCVHAIPLPLLANPAYIRNCGIWVVLPEPVSPTRISTWYSSTKATNFFFESNAGSFCLVYSSWQQFWEYGLPVRQLTSGFTLLMGTQNSSSPFSKDNFTRIS